MYVLIIGCEVLWVWMSHNRNRVLVIRDLVIGAQGTSCVSWFAWMLWSWVASMHKISLLFSWVFRWLSLRV